MSPLARVVPGTLLAGPLARESLTGCTALFGTPREQVAPNGSLSREAVADMTHEDLIQGLPSEERREASMALDRFCASFNRVFPLLSPNLYECTPNPFLDDRGGVDLTGTGTGGGRARMTRRSSALFGFPSLIPGEVDARSVCTVQVSKERVDCGVSSWGMRELQGWTPALW